MLGLSCIAEIVFIYLGINSIQLIIFSLLNDKHQPEDESFDARARLLLQLLVFWLVLKCCCLGQEIGRVHRTTLLTQPIHQGGDPIKVLPREIKEQLSLCVVSMGCLG